MSLPGVILQIKELQYSQVYTVTYTKPRYLVKLLARILLSAIAVLVIANFIPGVDVSDYKTAIFVAVILGVLNMFVKPVLTILTLPVTFLTFGLFLLVINAIIIFMAGYLIDGFSVDGWISAIIFSFLLSLLESFLFSVMGDSKK